MNKSMRYIKRLFVILSAVCATIVAHGQLSEFKGEWVNVDENSSGITKLQVNIAGETLKVRLFGRCHPIDCDWGWIDAVAYTEEGVAADLAATVSTVVATYKTGFATRVVIIKVSSETELDLEVLTHFEYGSDRSNISSSDSMKRDA